MNVYTASIRTVQNANSLYSIPVSNRELAILTDNLQSAMAIARAKCTSGEEVFCIYTSNENVIIDHAKVPTQQI